MGRRRGKIGKKGKNLEDSLTFPFLTVRNGYASVFPSPLNMLHNLGETGIS